MSMLAFRLFLKDKGGGKQHCFIPFVGSNLEVEKDQKRIGLTSEKDTLQ